MSKSQKKRLNLRKLGFKTTSSRASKSSAMISPGDVIMFNYPKRVGKGLLLPIPVLALAVSNDRTGQGALFLSKQGNKLLSAFDISTSSSEVTKIILKELYKNRRKCNYKVIKGLRSILGPDTYRTYNAKRISVLYEIYLI